MFTVDGALNKQNHRVYAVSREEADNKGGLYGTSKFPLYVMVWIGLTEKGATEPFFVEKTINSLGVGRVKAHILYQNKGLNSIIYIIP
ncbi:transposase [Brachionus plicatilis]|uniref:Transposase n=1 Tax=Brachionus plicatilis TaxID=10195 RepID=A0A3M7T4T9_BRAPC|nr:transposase [Brachionus plicatilis]